MGLTQKLIKSVSMTIPPALLNNDNDKLRINLAIKLLVLSKSLESSFYYKFIDRYLSTKTWCHRVRINWSLASSNKANEVKFLSDLKADLEQISLLVDSMLKALDNP